MTIEYRTRETDFAEDAIRHLANIRHVARELPKSVGHYHRTTLIKAAAALEGILVVKGVNIYAQPAPERLVNLADPLTRPEPQEGK